MMGGLAIPDGPRWGRQRGDVRESVFISLAGPGAGFGLAALVVLGIVLTGGEFRLRWEDFPVFFRFRLDESIDSDSWYALIGAMLYINIFWGLVNLLPVYPLDGGQVARALFVQADPWGGLIKSLWLSVVVGAAVAVWGLSQQAGSLFMAILFGSLAFQSYLAIQQQTGGGRPW
jgi:stage IV sporulation protein FB